MAISRIEYELIKLAKRQGVIAPQPAMLELGEANWYGDVPVQELARDIGLFVQEDGRRQSLVARIKALVERHADDGDSECLFELAKIFYQGILDPSRHRAIDLTGTAFAMPYDLNLPVALPEQFDLVLNLGTSEHIFNQYQFFKTVHDLTRPSGVMISGGPFQGWFDHGFFNYQPTFFFDLAAANDYVIHGLIYAELDPCKLVQLTNRASVVEMVKAGQIGANAEIYAILRKPAEEHAFRVPQQGYYAGVLSAEEAQAWRDLR